MTQQQIRQMRRFEVRAELERLGYPHAVWWLEMNMGKLQGMLREALKCQK